MIYPELIKHRKYDAIRMVHQEVTIVIDLYSIVVDLETGDYDWVLEKRGWRLYSLLTEAGYTIPSQIMDGKMQTPLWICKSILSTVHHWERKEHKQLDLFVKDRYDVIAYLLDKYNIAK